MCAFSLLLILLCVLEVRAQYGNGLTEGCAQKIDCAGNAQRAGASETLSVM
jgi:hypothetical protein